MSKSHGRIVCAALVGAVDRLGAVPAVALGVALSVVVDTGTVVVDVGGAVTVAVTDGELGVWHAVAPAIATALINAVNRIPADIRLPRV